MEKIAPANTYLRLNTLRPIADIKLEDPDNFAVGPAGGVYQRWIKFDQQCEIVNWGWKPLGNLFVELVNDEPVLCPALIEAINALPFDSFEE